MMAGHRLSGKTDYMIDNRHMTSQSGQILTRQHFLLLVYVGTLVLMYSIYYTDTGHVWSARNGRVGIPL